MARKLASSRSFVDAEPRLPSLHTVTFAVRPSRVPLVTTLLAAKLRCDCLLLPTLADASSALTIERIFSVSDLTSDSVSSIIGDPPLRPNSCQRPYSKQ